MDSEGGCDENLEADTCASNYRRVTFAPRIRFLNSDHGGGCRPDSKTNQELKSPDSSDTESSSLSNSSFDEFIQINTQILLKPSGENSISQPAVSTKPSNVKEKCIITNEALDDTHESVRDYMLPTLSPSIQMMERPEDVDRHGIGASNDAVFRIHITNKRKDALMTDVDLYKLDERPKTGESGVEPDRKLNTAKAIGEDVTAREKGTVEESNNYVSKSPMNNPFDTNARVSRDSSSATCQSVRKKYPLSLCHCPDFCSAFHCFKCPSCCSSKWIGWSGCSINCSWLGYCCKWPSGYCKCPIWSSCCVKRNY